MTAPHLAPDGSGAMTNLSDADYAKFTQGIAPTTSAAPSAKNSWLNTIPDGHGPPTDDTQMTGIMREPALVGSNLVKGATSVLGFPGDVARGVTWLRGQQAVGDLQGNPLPSPPTFAEPGQFEPLRLTTPQMLAAAPGKIDITPPTGHNPIDTETLLGLTGAIGVTDRPDLQPQGALENLLAAGSQGVGMVAPAALTGGISTVPAALRLAGTGAAMGVGGELGTEVGRQVGGKPGAIIGGLVGSATPAGIGLGVAKLGAAASGMKPLFSKNAREISVGRTLSNLVGKEPVEQSSVGPLSLSQATNSPEIAARTDLAPSYNATANAKLLKAQQDAIREQIGKIGAPSTSADASTAFTKSLRAGREVAGSEEKRLWSVPELSNATVTSTPVQQSVNAAVQSLDPVLQSGMSGQIRALVNRLNKALPEVSAKPNNPAARQFPLNASEAGPLPKVPTLTTMQDLNGIRSGLESIARTSLDGTERMIARRLSSAFMDGMDRIPEIAGTPAVMRPQYAGGPPGMENRMIEISPAVPAKPEIAEAYKTARDYTRRMRTMFGAPDSTSLLKKNAAGVFTRDASEGAGNFFNFSNGSHEGPESIAQLSDFISELKSQPMAPQIAGQMRDAARSYIASALSKAARVEEGQLFNPKTMQDFLRVNGPWIEKSGLFEQSQIDAAKQLMEYSGLIRRPEELLRQVNSATQARLARKDTFIDQIMNPTVRHIVELGGTLAAGHSHGGTGALVGMLMGGGFEKAVVNTETAMRELMAQALLDPTIAKGLMMKASAANRLMMSPQARQAIDRAKLAATVGVSTEAMTPTSPAGAAQQVTAQ